MRAPRGGDGGTTLIELLIVIFVVGVMVVSGAALMTGMTEPLLRQADESRAAALAAGLLEEIVVRRWDERTDTGSGSLGVDTGETAGNRSTFDDMDDFDGLDESPPRDPGGNGMSDFSDFTLKAEISYVNEADLSASTTPTPRKKIEISVWKDGKEFRRLATLRSLRTP